MAKRAQKKDPSKSATPTIAVTLPTNSADVPSTYANMLEMLSANHIDVRFAFNEVAVETGNVARAIRRANIVMPTAAFMHMVQILNANAQLIASKAAEQAARSQEELGKLLQSHIDAAKAAQK